MLFSVMSSELKMENTCQSTVEWLLVTQMQFLRKLQNFWEIWNPDYLEERYIGELLKRPQLLRSQEYLVNATITRALILQSGLLE